MKKTEILQIANSFESDVISEESLQNILKNNIYNYNGNYYHYYLFDLYKANIIYKYNKGIYKPCKDRKEFIFKIKIHDNTVESLKKINPKIIVSIWSLSEITKFMSLQIFDNINFIETYAYSKEIVLNTLMDQKLNAIYEEDYLSISKYMKGDELYIIRTINEDSPINRPRIFSSIKKTSSLITTPKIEKILIDIIISKFFDMLLGDEINIIVENILREYKINISTCLRYAEKKYRIDSVKDYLQSINFDIKRGEFEWF